MVSHNKLILILLLFINIIFLTGFSNTLALDKDNLYILKGDLHVHSNYSHDSDVPVSQVIEDSVTAGYDFISLTEHNTLRHLKKNLSTDELLVIPGYELTVTPIAHFNIFGIRNFRKKTAIYTHEEMQEYLDYLRELGGLIQLDHPNVKDYYSRYGYDYDLDFLELYNEGAGGFGEDDLQTLKDYQDLLCEGRKIVATGNTDCHRNHKDRNAYNNVLVRDTTEEAILEGLQAGRNFVTTDVDGPIIFLSCDDKIMGGTVDFHPGQKINITIKNIVPGIIVKVYTSNGLELEEIFNSKDNEIYIKNISTKNISFCRVELWLDNDVLCAYSNPIYVEQ